MARHLVILLAMLACFFIGISNALFEEDVPWLLAQRDAFTNWGEFSTVHSINGWDNSTPLCDWSCIECDNTAGTYNMDFYYCSDEASKPQIQGTLASELARCRSLSVLSLSYNQLQGTLPPDWGYSGSFQKLQNLSLIASGITGTLPASWATPGSFPAFRDLYLDSNKLSGTTPPEWFATGAFPKLVSLTIIHNNLSGTLHPEWAMLPSLETLQLYSNTFTGTLPEAWGQPNAFQKLRLLALYQNALSGTLPAWNVRGAFPQLERLYLDSNRFVGTVPNWKLNGSFPKLARLDLDENPGLCGAVPPSLNGAICPDSYPADMCSDGVAYLKPCPPPPPALPRATPPLLPPSPALPEPSPPTPKPPPAPPIDTSSSSVPIGAIVGAVAGAAALAALAFFGFRPGRGWLRNKAARGEAAAADALESGGKGAPPGGPGGAMPTATDTFLHPASIMQQPRGLLGSGLAKPAVDTFIEAKVFQPEGAFLASEQQPPVHSSLSSVASGSHGTFTPLANALAITAATSSSTNAPATPCAQRSVSSQPTSSSVSFLEGDALLSIIASHLSSRQPGGQQALQQGPGSSDSAARPAQLGSAVQGWEVAWGDIQVERLVGRGAFGMVYLGRWNELPVAVKLLVNKDGLAKQGLELPAGIMRALQQEASVMARTRHPHVVSFLGLCTVPPAILTEYCPRGSVYDNLQEGLHSPTAAAELTWRRRLSMAHDAAMGLLYLHRRGLIHRDIKSPNLLVTENWRVQVSDFNLAKLLGPAGSSSTSAGGPGNPQWLAPEVVQGGKASAASDVFSFGMVLLELLTWRLPWRDAPVWEIARQLREGLRPEVPPPNALPGQGMATAPGLDAYCQLMRECWAQSGEGRPTFADIVPRLRTLLEHA